MKREQVGIRVIWLGLGAFVALSSYRMGLGVLTDPGPGLFPFLLGVALVVVSGARLTTILRQPPDSSADEPKAKVDVQYWKLVASVSALLGWALLLEPLGFLVATFLMMTILYRVAGYKEWHVAGLWSLGTVVVSFFVFSYLGVRFPPGMATAFGLY